MQWALFIVISAIIHLLEFWIVELLVHQLGGSFFLPLGVLWIKKMQKRAAAELTDSEVRKGQLELLAKLKDEGLLTEDQVKAQAEGMA